MSSAHSATRWYCSPAQCSRLGMPTRYCAEAALNIHMAVAPPMLLALPLLIVVLLQVQHGLQRGTLSILAVLLLVLLLTAAALLQWEVRTPPSLPYGKALEHQLPPQRLRHHCQCARRTLNPRPQLSRQQQQSAADTAMRNYCSLLRRRRQWRC